MTDRLSVGLLCDQLLAPVPGGIGTYVRALLHGLPAQGVDLIPLAAWHRADRIPEPGLRGARRLPLPRRPLHEAWSRTGLPRPRVEADVLHAPSLAFPRRGEMPLVVTAHDVLFLEFPAAYPRHGLAFHRRALGRLGQADLVICPSEAAARALRSVGAPARRVEVIPMGTNLDPPEDPDPVLRRLKMERPYVLWVGTVEPRKNLERAIRSFLRATGPEGHAGAGGVKLYLVGPVGWLGGAVQRLLGRSDVGERVRRVGVLGREALAAAYAGAEALLFPSLGEGFGLPVLEAMACGAPVVTSDRSSLPEVAGDAAMLCDPLDEGSIAAALSSVLSDRALADELRRRGRARARLFTWERTARETAAGYRELAARTS